MGTKIPESHRMIQLPGIWNWSYLDIKFGLHGLCVETGKRWDRTSGLLLTASGLSLHLSEGFSRELQLNLYQGKEGTCVFEDDCRVSEELSFLNLLMEHFSPAQHMLLCYMEEFALTFHLILLAWFWNKIKVVVSEKERFRKVKAYNNPQIPVLCCLKCAVTGHTTTVLLESLCRAGVLHVLSLLLWSLCLDRSSEWDSIW